MCSHCLSVPENNAPRSTTQASHRLPTGSPRCGAWPKPPIRDINCCHHPLTGCPVFPDHAGPAAGHRPARRCWPGPASSDRCRPRVHVRTILWGSKSDPCGVANPWSSRMAPSLELTALFLNCRHGFSASFVRALRFGARRGVAPPVVRSSVRSSRTCNGHGVIKNICFDDDDD